MLGFFVNLEKSQWDPVLCLSYVSATGFGGYTVEHGNLMANGQWSAEEAAQSSTYMVRVASG